MQYHILPKKGMGDAIKAFQIVKEKYPKTILMAFGAYRPQNDLPFGTKFFFLPSPQKKRQLYSEADIFLWPSLEEGFGLPPLEAMACGAVVVATDTGVMGEYVKNDENAILVPPGQPEVMAEKILELLEDKEKRKYISSNAPLAVHGLAWEKSNDTLEKILLGN